MVVYILFFAYLYFKYIKFKSPVLNFVLLFYLAAAVCGILTHYFVEPGAYATILSVPYQILILYLFLKPIIEYGKHENNRKFLRFDDKRFKLLCYALIGLQLFTIYFFASYVIGLVLRGDLGQIRSELILGVEDGLGASLGRTIAGTASYYFCINILLFFYSLAVRNDSKWLLILLIVSSSSRIFHALTYMGRDGLLFWILSFVFSYMLFYPYLKVKTKKIANRAFLIIGGVTVFLIFLISRDRFAASDTGTFLSLVSYLGEPLNNFGQLFDKFHDYKGVSALFPIFWGGKGTSGAEAIANADTFYLKYGFYSNIFFSFVGNLYISIGPILTFLFALFYSKYMTSKFRSGTTSMSKLIILMFVSQIVLHNYFYWAYYIRVGNLFVLTIPLFIMYCRKSDGFVTLKSDKTDDK